MQCFWFGQKWLSMTIIYTCDMYRSMYWHRWLLVSTIVSSDWIHDVVLLNSYNAELSELCCYGFINYLVGRVWMEFDLIGRSLIKFHVSTDIQRLHMQSLSTTHYKIFIQNSYIKYNTCIEDRYQVIFNPNLSILIISNLKNFNNHMKVIWFVNKHSSYSIMITFCFKKWRWWDQHKCELWGWMTSLFRFSLLGRHWLTKSQGWKIHFSTCLV